MSLSKFVDRVRIAASPFPPEVWADPNLLLTTELDRARKFEDIWLAPVTVRGFTDADLRALPPADQTRVRSAVEAFRAVADQVRPGAAATAEQSRDAVEAFATILGALKPFLADPEMLSVRRAVWRGCEPYHDLVLTFDFELKEDSSGEPSVWVWLILTDDADVETRDIQLELYEVRDAIRKELDAAGIRRLLYTSVWGRSEVPAVLAWEPV